MPTNTALAPGWPPPALADIETRPYQHGTAVITPHQPFTDEELSRARQWLTVASRESDYFTRIELSAERIVVPAIPAEDDTMPSLVPAYSMAEQVADALERWTGRDLSRHAIELWSDPRDMVLHALRQLAGAINRFTADPYPEGDALTVATAHLFHRCDQLAMLLGWAGLVHPAAGMDVSRAVQRIADLAHRDEPDPAA